MAYERSENDVLVVSGFVGAIGLPVLILMMERPLLPPQDLIDYTPLYYFWMLLFLAVPGLLFGTVTGWLIRSSGGPSTMEQHRQRVIRKARIVAPLLGLTVGLVCNLVLHTMNVYPGQETQRLMRILVWVGPFVLWASWLLWRWISFLRRIDGV